MNDTESSLQRFFAIRELLSHPERATSSPSGDCGDLWENLRSDHAPLRNISAELLGKLAAADTGVFRALVERYPRASDEEKVMILRALWYCPARKPALLNCLSEWIQSAQSSAVIARLLLTMVAFDHPAASDWVTVHSESNDPRISRVVLWSRGYRHP